MIRSITSASWFVCLAAVLLAAACSKEAPPSAPAPAAPPREEPEPRRIEAPADEEPLSIAPLRQARAVPQEGDVRSAADASPGTGAPLADTASAPADATAVQADTAVAAQGDAASGAGGASGADATHSGADVGAVGADGTSPAGEEAPAAAGLPQVPAAATAGIDAEKQRKVFEEAMKLLQANKVDQSTQLLEEWLRATPKDLLNRRNLAHVYVQMQRFEEAELHLKLLADEMPGQAEWHAHLGRIQAKLGKFGPAAESLEKALTISPEDVDVALDLARVHASRRQLDAARDVLEKTLVLKKKEPELLKELTAVLVEQGAYNQAWERFWRLQKLEPTYETALTMARLAARNRRCTDVYDALAGWDKQFKTETPFYLLGECAITDNDLDRAVKQLQTALEKNEKCFECSLRLGDVWFEKKEWARAAQYYGIAVNADPKDFRPWQQLGKSLGNAGKHIEASRAFAGAVERKPDDAELLYMWGVELVMAGQKADAWKTWGRLDGMDRNLGNQLKKMLNE
ncbi:MAG: tetratricopeptide repeat protein [Deltaproteobacteria bacterium]|nr:tetratricopeptide repeat protein [Deltaproteobacteria bacterium]